MFLFKHLFFNPINKSAPVFLTNKNNRKLPIFLV